LLSIIIFSSAAYQDANPRRQIEVAIAIASGAGFNFAGIREELEQFDRGVCFSALVAGSSHKKGCRA
jgi:hypothetical protein